MKERKKERKKDLLQSDIVYTKVYSGITTLYTQKFTA